MTLIDLVLRGRKLKVKYITIDSDGFCTGFMKIPKYNKRERLKSKTDEVLWYILGECIMVGQYDGCISDATKYIIELKNITL